MMNRNLPSFSLALYGWHEQFDYGILLPVFEKYFDNLSLKPNSCSVSRRGVDEVKAFSFKTVKNRIASGQLKDLATLSLDNLADKSDKQSHIVAMGVNESFPDPYGTQIDQHAIFINAVSDLNHSKDLALTFLRDVVSYVTPVYGYSLELPLSHDPYFYSLGMFAREERMWAEASAWQNASHAAIRGTKHREGYFRHVFEINVLSPNHLKKQIDGVSFENWVEQSGHGQLEKLNEIVWLWTVPKPDRIRAAQALQRNGLLTAPEGFESELIG
jgi:hypothetical protein